MLYEPTIQKMQAMKLSGMVEALEEQRKTADMGAWSFEDRLALLVERQWLWKENRALATRLKYARLRQPACLEDIDYRHHRGLQRSVMEHLAGGDWIQYSQNCLITGPTGVGKSYLACALAQKACRDGYRAAVLLCAQTLPRTDGRSGGRKSADPPQEDRQSPVIGHR